MPSRNRNFIQRAVKKPGSFTRYCQSHGYNGVTNQCITTAKHSRSLLTRRRANLANTFRHLPERT